MQKFLNIKNIVALVLIGICLIDYVPSVVPSKPKIDLSILNIDKPNEDIIKLVQPISVLITDPTDRAKLAIYSQEFAIRIKSYDTDCQQVNDVLAISAKEFFQDTMTDKYQGLDDGIIELIKSSTGEENHKLTPSEKEDLSSKFMGLAWSLIQKG